MKMTFQVRIRRNGQITLPKELRDRSLIESGTMLTLHDLGNGAIVMSRTQSRADKIADQLAQEWREAGETLESMLATLRQVRKDHDTPKGNNILDTER
jgi:AbrB family looped-hinge helix DNA binding protein